MDRGAPRAPSGAAEFPRLEAMAVPEDDEFEAQVVAEPLPERFALPEVEPERSRTNEELLTSSTCGKTG